MQSQTVNSENLATTPWEDDYFQFCKFEDFAMEGGHVTSEFVGCSFRNLDWYWGMFNVVNFVDCRFTACVFRGAAFPDCRFVDCALIDCRFLKDNLDGDCDFDGAVAYGCLIVGGEGFLAESIGPPRRSGTVFPSLDPRD